MYKILIPALLVGSIEAASHDNKLELGVKSSFYNYTERDDQDKILDTEESELFDIGGVYGSYEHKLNESIQDNKNIVYYLNVKGSFAAGDTDYKGALLQPTPACPGYPCLKSTTYNQYLDLEVNLKRVSEHNNKTTYISAGLGYHYWLRELNSNQEEIYSWAYAQISAGATTQIYQDWTIGLDLTAQLAIDPTMEADFNGGSNGNLDETFDLGTTYTYKVAVPFNLPLEDGLSFVAKAEYEFTKINKSNVIISPTFIPCSVNGCYEPDSQQKNWHFYAGVQLDF